MRPLLSHDDRPTALDAAMARYASGNEAAFVEVYDELAPVLARFLRRRTRDRPLIEDLIQETFLRIHQHRGLYRTGSSVIPWAVTIAVRLLINHARGAGRARLVFTEDGHGAHEGASLEAGPEEMAGFAELADRLDQEILRLPPHLRAAFQLVKGEGLPLKEAASVLGTTETGVKMRLFRIYDRLRPLAKRTPAEPDA